MQRYHQTTNVDFERTESSVSEGVFTPTTARTDTFAEYCRGALVVDTLRLTVPIEEIDFSTIEQLD